MEEDFFELSIEIDKGPIVAAAIHNGHDVRDSLEGKFNLSSEERLREEDPYTGRMAKEFGNHIVVNRSRFEVDLNRSPEKAVYKKPEDAWGLQVWKEPLPEAEIEESMRMYHHFYQQVEEKLAAIVDAHGYVIVYDIHSYNHRRKGPDAPAANPKENPDVDLLTDGIDMRVWRPVLDKFKKTLRDYPYPGGSLDVREEVRFEGIHSHFMQWVLQRFDGKAFVPSIEFKKIFMDEWTGNFCTDKLVHLQEALKQSMPRVLHEARVNQKIPELL